MGKKPTEVEGREMKPDTPLKAAISLIGGIRPVEVAVGVEWW